MRMEDLSAEQRKLLSTDFGDLEKVAADQAKLAGEMYNRGLEIALNIADGLDKEAAEAEKTAGENHELPDAHSEKTAQQMGAFIERGQYDGLKKLGADRHSNEWHYFLPFVEEKVAAAGAKAGLDRFRQFITSKAKGVAGKAKDVGGKVVDYHKNIGSHARQAATGKPTAAGGNSIKGKAESTLRGLTGKERAMEAGKAVGKASPYAAAAGLGAAAASRKKDD